MCLLLLVMLFLLLVYKFGIQLFTCQHSSIFTSFFILSGSVEVVFINLSNIGAFASQTLVNCSYSLPIFSCCFPLR